MKVTVDTSDFRRYERDLKRFGEAHAHGQRNALNGCAFEAQKAWRTEVKRTFTLRTQFTERSIQVDKAKGLDLRTMQASVGSVAPYMEDQEEGAVVHGRGKHKAIPAAVAGGAAGPGIRPRPVLGRYRLPSIKVANPKVGRFGRKKRNAIAMSLAVKTGNKFALLSKAKGGGRALFEVRKVSKRKFKTRLIWNVDRASVHLKPEPTMHRAIARSMSAFERITQNALREQLRRAGEPF
jgi:hypothetical protein